MAYFVNLFSPETYEAFSKSDRTISGFRKTQENAASKICPGDRLVCYMTKLSRWIGILEVIEPFYYDETPIFYTESDPFVLRFKVKPLVWLEKDKTIPIKDDELWNSLTFTRDYDKNTSTWTGRLRASLTKLDDADGRLIESLLLNQAEVGVQYPLNEREYAKLITHQVRRTDKVVSVSIPDDTDTEGQESIATIPEARDSIKIQALIAGIGAKMGMRIWIPRNDKAAVLNEWSSDESLVLNILPLNYDETTLKTIEQIDILWLRGRSIVRAFEVEHTTSIYSGILRMADLLALQPNMEIKLHIVAPSERRDKVFQELRRPVFSLLEKGPLSESCTYISYDNLRELSKLKHLSHLSDSVLDEYAEDAE